MKSLEVFFLFSVLTLNPVIRIHRSKRMEQLNYYCYKYTQTVQIDAAVVNKLHCELVFFSPVTISPTLITLGLIWISILLISVILLSVFKWNNLL